VDRDGNRQPDAVGPLVTGNVAFHAGPRATAIRKFYAGSAILIQAVEKSSGWRILFGVSALYVYGACVAFGGVMLLASMLMGGHDVGAGGGDLPVPDGAGAPGVDVHLAGTDAHAAGAHGAAGGGSALAVALSLRFWIFAVTFFGVTGLVVTGLGGAGTRALAPLVAAPVGLAAGFVASRVFAALSARAVGAVAPSSSYIGRDAVLMLPVSRAQRGKLRLRVGATEVDLLAETDEDAELPIGASVLVCGVRGQALVVAHHPAPPTTSKG
jgi:hypothetical protein